MWYFFCRRTGAKQFEGALRKGYDFFINTFFGPDGTPYTFRYGGSGVPNRTAAGGVAGCVGTTCVGGDYQGLTSSAGGGSVRNVSGLFGQN